MARSFLYVEKKFRGCKMAKVEEQVEALVLQLLAGQQDIELVDVEYVKERDWYLRVYIDKPGGIEIDDCQSLSEQLETKLDAENLISDSYILEVSSPGIDRVLRKKRDFEREQGKMVEVTLYAPLPGQDSKLLIGELTGHDDESITLDGEQCILLKQAAQIRLHIEF